MIQALTNFDLPVVMGALLFVFVIQAALYVAATVVGAAVSEEWRRG